MSEISSQVSQNVFIYNREKLELTGVRDVCSFSESSVEMTLDEGFLAIDGENLKIDNFASSSGKISIIGRVNAVTYYGKTVKTKKNKQSKS